MIKRFLKNIKKHLTFVDGQCTIIIKSIRRLWNANIQRGLRMEKIKEEKKMKKLLALLLASTMVLSMAACGQKSDAPAATGENSASQAAAGDSEGTYTYHDSVRTGTPILTSL